MRTRPRYLAPQVLRDLARKMVLLSGPRQVGKTTLARRILGHDNGYLNWDVAEDRERILRRQFPATRLWVLDEIHKFRSLAQLPQGAVGRQAFRPAHPGHGQRQPRALSFRGRLVARTLSPVTTAPAVGRRARPYQALGAARPAHLGWLSRAVLLGLRGRGPPLVARVPQPDRARGNDQPGTGDGPGSRRADDAAPARPGGFAPVGQFPARGPASQPQDGREHWLQILERLHAIFRVPPFGAP